jgi:signal transduction histidine kinase
MVGYHRLFEGPRHQGILRKNLENYVEYIIKELGVPPDKERAMELQKEFSFHIRYDSAEYSWATIEDFPSREELERKRTFHRHRHMGGRKGQFYYVSKKDHGTYIFATDFRRFFEPNKLYFAGLIGLLTIILAGSYMAIRWIFKPVKWLEEGVAEIGRGNLDHRIPTRKRRDELGELAVSFNDMAERIKKMVRAKEQLLLDVSHELRSPVTRMRVALEFVSDGEKKESLLEDVGELEAMITELLESEKLNSDHGKLDIETIDLASLLRETIKEFEIRPPGVVLMPVSEVMNIDGDAERVKVVLKNVIENAIKYSNPDNRAVEVAARKEAGAIVVTIRDHGIGIPKEDLSAIFEPFYRADKSRSRNTGGYGLGMSLCKKIMDAHGGSIGIESTHGEGTTVRLEFR